VGNLSPERTETNAGLVFYFRRALASCPSRQRLLAIMKQSSAEVSGMVKEDETLTFAGELLLLIEAAPRCNCGGNCETLKFLVEQLPNL